MFMIATLSKVAIELKGILDDVPPQARKTINKGIHVLEQLVTMMTAIQETIEVISENAEDIFDVVDDGTDASFINGITSVTILVQGRLKRKSNTLRIQEIDLTKKPQGRQMQLNDNVFKIHC